MNQKNLFAQSGDELKKQGMETASRGKESQIRNGTIRFLRAILKSKAGRATIDDASECLETFGDGGKWRGSITKTIANAGIIQRDGVASSKRPSRHGSLISCWRLIDREAALDMLVRLYHQAEKEGERPL